MSEFRNVAIVINVTAGSADKISQDALNKNIALISQAMDVKIFKTRSLDEGRAAIKSMAGHPPDLLIIIGGDGTVISAISQIKNEQPFKKMPHFLVVAGGTTNMIHRDAGVGIDDLDSAFQNVLYEDYTQYQRPLLKITSSHNNESKYGFFAGFGALPHAIEHVRKTYHKAGLTGKIGETLACCGYIIRLLAGSIEKHPVLSPNTIKLSENGQKWARKRQVFMFFTTLSQLILDFKPPKRPKSYVMITLRFPYSGLLGDLIKLRKNERPGRNALEQEERTKPLYIKHCPRWILDGEFATLPQNAHLKVELDSPVTFIQ